MTVTVRPRRRIAIIGIGRAGGSFALALGAAGWSVRRYHRGDDTTSATRSCDVVLLCCPDSEIENVASRLVPSDSCVVVHVAGSVGTAVLADHPRVGAVHPLMSLPNAEVGSERLQGAWFAVAGDPVVDEIVASLGGRSFRIADEDRSAYHAAAAVASNHLVAILGQVERIATLIGAPAEAYLALARASLDNTSSLGARAALTGPAARGDSATIDRHRQALRQLFDDDRELNGYDALVALAELLAGR